MTAAVQRLQHAVSRLAEQVRGRVPTGLSHQDADDVAGTVDSDGALCFNPLPLLRALDECGAQVVVIGQVAGIMHGSEELTGDLDLLWDGDIVQAARLVEGFARVDAELSDDDSKPVTLDVSAFHLPKVLFESPYASGDCCTTNLPWGSIPVTNFLERCSIAEAPDGFKIRYVALDDLISMRRAVGRPKDLRRAEELEQLRRNRALLP